MYHCRLFMYKYLGVTISSNLQWKSHVESVVMKANRLLGFIRVVAGKASTTAIFSLYKSLVLPILKYACPAWHPSAGTAAGTCSMNWYTPGPQTAEG